MVSIKSDTDFEFVTKFATKKEAYEMYFLVYRTVMKEFKKNVMTDLRRMERTSKQYEMEFKGDL